MEAIIRNLDYDALESIWKLTFPDEDIEDFMLSFDHTDEEDLQMRNITKKHAVMMEYVIIAVLIAAAVVVAVIMFGKSVSNGNHWNFSCHFPEWSSCCPFQ